MVFLVLVACLLLNPVQGGFFDDILPEIKKSKTFQGLVGLVKDLLADPNPVKDVRLVNGTEEAGRLEIEHKGTWGTVCEDEFGREEALVACKMLQIHDGKAVYAKSIMFGAGSDEQQILLSDLKCNGTEKTLWDCKHSGLYNHSCSHSKDIGIICNFNADQLRLSGKRRINQNMGRVEIKAGGVWSGVCGSFSSSSAKSICRQLGYPSTSAMTTMVSPFGPRESRGVLEVNLNCTGNESRIKNCLLDPLFYSAKCNKEELGVICSNRTTSLYVVVESSTEYPFMEGQHVSLKCEKTQSKKLVANYSWPETAGGSPFGQFLIFDNVTREHNGMLVGCAGSYGDNNEQLIYSDTTILQVYCAPKSKASDGKLKYVTIRDNKQNFSVEIIAYPTPHLANITYQGSTIKERIEKPVDSKEIHAVCVANSFEPALVICNISIIHAVEGFYQAVFSNDFGDLPIDFVVVSNSSDGSRVNLNGQSVVRLSSTIDLWTEWNLPSECRKTGCNGQRTVCQQPRFTSARGRTVFLPDCGTIDEGVT